jgi:phage shock protein C
MTAPIKRLYRSRDDGQIAGVCAGLGEYFNIDPVVLRLAAVAGTFLTGLFPGLLTYLAAWLIVPPEPLPLPMRAPAPPSPAADQASPQAPAGSGA